MLLKEYKLRSGRHCELHRLRDDVIPNYYLLSFSSSCGEPSATELGELIAYGTQQAKQLAMELTSDPEAYTLVYSGYSARCEKGWHIHIFLLGNRWRKAWLYLLLSLKNLAQAIGLRKDDAPKV